MHFESPAAFVARLRAWPRVRLSRPTSEVGTASWPSSSRADDFHVARQDGGVWTEKFRGEPPRVMGVTLQQRPVSADPAYRFSRYMYLPTGEDEEGEEEEDEDEDGSLAFNLARYTRDGEPLRFFRRRGV